MTKQSVIDLISRATMGVSKLPPATEAELTATELILGRSIPSELRYFLSSISNGLNFGDLRLLPVKSQTNLKKTGDSIARNNDQSASIWFNGDISTFNEFLVFCIQESHTCYCLKRYSEYVWIWSIDSEEAEELDYDFWSWMYESLMQEGHLLRFRP